MGWRGPRAWGSCGRGARWRGLKTADCRLPGAGGFQDCGARIWRRSLASAPIYLRLEQGQDQRPSVQVIDAVATALQLDADATAHLHVLAQPDAVPRRSGQAERAPASIEQLIASWPNTPAAPA
jgi:hypothetical protein